MRTRRPVVLLLALMLSAAGANAQSVSPSGPRAGTWGAELSYGNTMSLLHFSSPRAAWLLGADLSGGRTISEQPSQLGGTVRDTTDFGAVALRLGRRWYRGEAASALRPVAGLGLTGGYMGGQPGRSWSAGGYGEVGAAYFFNPHVSLGATGDIHLKYTDSRYEYGGPAVLRERSWFLSANSVHINAAVYF